MVECNKNKKNAFLIHLSLSSSSYSLVRLLGVFAGGF